MERGSEETKEWYNIYYTIVGFSGGASGKESARQCRRHGFNPWVGKIPWRRTWRLCHIVGMATRTHSRILAWRTPWTEEPRGLQSTGSQSDKTEVTSHALLYCKSVNYT